MNVNYTLSRTHTHTHIQHTHRLGLVRERQGKVEEALPILQDVIYMCACVGVGVGVGVCICMCVGGCMDGWVGGWVGVCVCVCVFFFVCQEGSEKDRAKKPFLFLIM